MSHSAKEFKIGELVKLNVPGRDYHNCYAFVDSITDSGRMTVRYCSCGVARHRMVIPAHGEVIKLTEAEQHEAKTEA